MSLIPEIYMYHAEYDALCHPVEEFKLPLLQRIMFFFLSEKDKKEILYQIELVNRIRRINFISIWNQKGES